MFLLIFVQSTVSFLVFWVIRLWNAFLAPAKVEEKKEEKKEQPSAAKVRNAITPLPLNEALFFLL